MKKKPKIVQKNFVCSRGFKTAKAQTQSMEVTNSNVNLGVPINSRIPTVESILEKTEGEDETKAEPSLPLKKKKSIIYLPAGESSLEIGPVAETK